MSKNFSTESGLNFTGALTLLFIGLKLADFIDWAWIWVLSPIWINLLFIVGIMIVVIGIYYSARGIKKIKK